MNALTCVLPDAPSTEQQDLFAQKLQQCCVIFDFLDSVTDLKSKEIKRATLNELVEYVSTNRGVLVESAYPEITDMVSTPAVLTKCSRFETQRRASLMLGICSDGATAPNSRPRCFNDSRTTFSSQQSLLQYSRRSGDSQHIFAGGKEHIHSCPQAWNLITSDLFIFLTNVASGKYSV